MSTARRVPISDVSELNKIVNYVYFCPATRKKSNGLYSNKCLHIK